MPVIVKPASNQLRFTAMSYLSANDARCEILELADRYGAEFVLKELVVQMSGDDAREFVDFMQRNEGNW